MTEDKGKKIKVAKIINEINRSTKDFEITKKD